MNVIKTEDGYKVRVEVTNTGEVDASEVVQVYSKVKDSKVLRPIKELKGFTKVHLLFAAFYRIEFESGECIS